MAAPVPAEVLSKFGDQRWRLNNLYWITDKEGRRVRFELNWAQDELLRELHYLNLILKARQLGFTTLIQIYMLDVSLFFPDTRCGIIAQTQNDAQTIFRDKIKFPYDNLPEQLRTAVPIVRDNTTTLELANNSVIQVGTSLRSGTLQYLHISEFGKICAKYPHKAREIVTGALNTIQAGQIAFIESTAEGQEGQFYDMCQTAQSKRRTGESLTTLDWKFHFYPWWREPAYAIDPTGIVIPEPLERYFEEIRTRHGVTLIPAQKAWYTKKAETQGADMKREYPSTPDEAFEASVEGAYYAEQIAKAELDGRIGLFPPHHGVKVHTVWDIGVGDYTTIWFFQVTINRIRLIGCYHNSGEGMPHYLKQLYEIATDRGWSYGEHWLPHDAKVKEWGSGRTRVEQLIDGIILENGEKFSVSPNLVPMHGIDDGINAAREIFSICEFDAGPCADGTKALKAYRKEWDEERGVWKDKPRHDSSSHYADGFRYLAMAYREIKPSPAPKPPIAGIENLTLDRLWDDRKAPRHGRI